MPIKYSIKLLDSVAQRTKKKLRSEQINFSNGLNKMLTLGFLIGYKNKLTSLFKSKRTTTL